MGKSEAAKKAWITRRKKHGKTGLSKEHRAKKKPKKKKKKGKRKGIPWGPGNPLYEWQQKQK